MRQIKSVFQIGRLYTVHPNVGECYYLRLLLTHVRGPKSFEDIKTVDGVVYGTFREACEALQLLESDRDLIASMEEACADRSASAGRMLFAIILSFSESTNPTAMWLRFRAALSEDMRHAAEREERQISDEEVYNECLIRIEDIVLASVGRTFGDGPGQIPLPATDRHRYNQANYEIVRETSYNRETMLDYCNARIPLLTEEQRQIFDRVIETIELGQPKVFFLKAPGGTGKMFLLNLILAKIRSQGKIILACASSGIASTLLDGGRTAHSTFKIPLTHQEVPICSIRRGTSKAELMAKCSAIIWDECTMSKKEDAEAVDRTMQDIRRNARFGGVVVLFAGDFRQTLPVIAKSTPADTIEACLTNSYIWPYVHTLSLTRNMRAHMSNDQGAVAFSALLLRMGNGLIPCSDNMEIPVTLNMCVSLRNPEALIDAVFPNLTNHIDEPDWLSGRAILAPLNADVDELNISIQDRLQNGHITRLYYSIDQCIDPDQAVHFPVEVLNSLEISNFPKHELRLKVASPIIMLRNIQPPMLCNGTRLNCSSIYICFTMSWFRDFNSILFKYIISER